MLDSIHAIDIVCYVVGVCSGEGPLWEVPLCILDNELSENLMECLYGSELIFCIGSNKLKVNEHCFIHN